MKRLTTEEFIEKAKEVHKDKYDYSKSLYISSRTKLIITCLSHGDFMLAPAQHIYGLGCPICRNVSSANLRRLSTDDFIKKAKSVHGDKYDYSKTEYTGASNKICIICREHGEFTQIASDHLNGKGCRKCAHNAKYSTADFIRLAQSIHGNKYNYSKVNYINNKTKVCIVCPLHGEFFITPDSHINRKYGCWQCGVEVRSKHKTHTTKEFVSLAVLKHGNKYDYTQTHYIHGHKKVKIICKKHGAFYQTPNSHLNGEGCPKCVLKGQYKLFEKLCDSFSNENILFEVGSSVIPWVGKLRLDIYFPEYNIAVEYDGEYHFKCIQKFKLTNIIDVLRKDAFKTNLCKLNQCTLFRVKYNYTNSDFQNLVNNIKNIIYERTRNRVGGF